MEKVLLKNKEERAKWLQNYKAWGVYKEFPELNLKFYKYDFENGDYVIATEYLTEQNMYYTGGYKARYHLILSKQSEYKSTYGQCYTYYEPSGCAEGTIIDYLTKMKIEVLNNEM